MNTKTVMEDLIRGKIKIADDPDRESSQIFTAHNGPPLS